MQLPLSLPHFYGRGTHVPGFPSLQLRFYAKTNQTNHRAGEVAQGIQVIASKPDEPSLILGDSHDERGELSPTGYLLWAPELTMACAPPPHAHTINK